MHFHALKKIQWNLSQKCIINARNRCSRIFTFFVFCSFILFGGQIFVTLFLSAISERERERNTLFFVVNFQVYCVNFPHAQHFTSRHRSCEENRIEKIFLVRTMCQTHARVFISCIELFRIIFFSLSLCRTGA